MEKKTKILATISDLRCDKEFLSSLIANGVNAFRINTAWQEPEDTLKVIKNIRAVTDTVPIIIDTKGPEIRTSGNQPILTIEKGEELLIGHNLKDPKSISISYAHIARDVQKDDTILIDDGDIAFKVLRKKGDTLVVQAMNNGMVKPKKGVNIPGVHIELPSLTKKDRDYIDFCISHDIEFIAHSFVRGKEDLDAIQSILDKRKSKVKIIAKIENQEGVDNVEDILDHCYGVMIARGDLGIEIPLEKIPLVQKKLIRLCRMKKKVSIVATQMLHSMISNPRPTRSEVTDVANAIVQGTDCVMLSGETSEGEYPIEAVQMMSRVALEIEREKQPFSEIPVKSIQNEVSSFLAKSAVAATISLPVKAIIADTMTGRTGRYIAAFRSSLPIYMQCYEKRVMRELSLFYGVFPSYMKRTKTVEGFLHTTLKTLEQNTSLQKKDLIVVLAGSFGPTHGASFIEISSVGDLLRISG